MIGAGSVHSDAKITANNREAIAVEAMAAEDSAAGWVPFYASLFGRGGILERHLTPLQRLAYRQSDDFIDLHERLADMRSKDRSKVSRFEPVQLITTRVPRSLHLALIDEALECGVSIQQLCLTKLLLPADPRFVPHQARLRGRRPGPQKGDRYASDPPPPPPTQGCDHDGQDSTRPKGPDGNPRAF